jgi:hypothetical protein
VDGGLVMLVEGERKRRERDILGVRWDVQTKFFLIFPSMCIRFNVEST